MDDVIPTGSTRDSAYLFDRMTQRTLDLAGGASGQRILDVASGFGQDAISLSERGAWAVGVEPSARMSALSRLQAQKSSARRPRARSAGRPPASRRPSATRSPASQPRWLRGWADSLPFTNASFDAVICKGALDHFDQPSVAIAEMARVTRRGGRVVLAIANFESLSCRVARSLEAIQEGWLARPPRRGRRHYDVPSDHFTRYELDLMCEQASCALELEVVEGISMGWGMRGWSRCVERLPAPVAQTTLVALDRLARSLPALADVVMLAGRPRAINSA
jgi:SAM-dependent methyltransferase